VPIPKTAALPFGLCGKWQNKGRIEWIDTTEVCICSEKNVDYRNFQELASHFVIRNAPISRAPVYCRPPANAEASNRIREGRSRLYMQLAFMVTVHGAERRKRKSHR